MPLLKLVKSRKSYTFMNLERQKLILALTQIRHNKHLSRNILKKIPDTKILSALHDTLDHFIP
ncbi:hypothetical protein Fokcrypt_00059 [Candidatus Fokinia cryptica]|uniref:Uncharacterized protein n=1 Tax=Candidatus Fokinia crypta TaxID=1920990 RepID=A0ABZ0UN52_9RICK|nr:hypothetical protein Fokcrypt_00059 [Candidatus Fokinia cryptica]